MKRTKLLVIIGVAALLATVFQVKASDPLAGIPAMNPSATVNAQEVTTNASGGTTTVVNPVDQSGTLAGLFSGNTNGIFASIGQGVSDFANFIEGTTNNARITIEAGGLYAKDLKQWGGFMNIYLPVSGTNDVLGAGFGVAYLNQDWYDATLSARLGSMIPLPFNAQKLLPLYAYIESGGGYNFHDQHAIAQAFTGASLRYAVARTKSGNTVDVTVGAAIGTISDIPGNVEAFGGSVSFHF